MALNLRNKIKLRDFLSHHFNITELKLLCFEIGIEYDQIPHEVRDQFSMELIEYCERRDLLGCLLQYVAKRRPHADVFALLTNQPCDPIQKVVVLAYAENLMVSEEEFLAFMAKAFGATNPGEVILLSAKRGSIELLLAMRRSVLERIIDFPKRIGPFNISEPVLFEDLNKQDRYEWRQHYPNYSYDQVRYGRRMTRNLYERMQIIVATYEDTFEESQASYLTNEMLNEDRVAYEFLELLRYSLLQNGSITTESAFEILEHLYNVD